MLKRINSEIKNISKHSLARMEIIIMLGLIVKKSKYKIVTVFF